MISRRALNRATLARQHLLTRTGRSPVELVEHLVGTRAVWNRSGPAARSRFITDDYLAQNFDADGPMPRVILIDGVTNGLWLTDIKRKQAVRIG